MLLFGGEAGGGQDEAEVLNDVSLAPSVGGDWAALPMSGVTLAAIAAGTAADKIWSEP